MRIDHIAIWCDDLERMREFYTTYFGCSANDIYRNPGKGYASYFLTFSSGTARIELMHRTDICIEPEKRGFEKGWAHLSICVGEREDVDSMVERLHSDGHRIIGPTRLTGDGYYEAVVEDVEGNVVELVANK
jgi:lactoylglutathione lyase